MPVGLWRLGLAKAIDGLEKGAPKVPLEIISCSNGHPNASGQAFCGQCGIELAPVCPNGHATAPGQRFCPDCGASLADPKPVAAIAGADTASSITAPPEPSIEPSISSTPLSTGEMNWLNRQSSVAQSVISSGFFAVLILIGNSVRAEFRDSTAEIVVVTLLALCYLAGLCSPSARSEAPIPRSAGGVNHRVYSYSNGRAQGLCTKHI